MKRNSLLMIILSGFFLFAFIGQAQQINQNQNQGSTDLASLIGAPGSVLSNFFPTTPLTTEGIPMLLINIRNFIMFLGIVLSIIFFVLAGINYMRSEGDEAKLEQARKQFFGGVIGTLVVVAAFVILNTIAQTLSKSFDTLFDGLK